MLHVPCSMPNNQNAHFWIFFFCLFFFSFSRNAFTDTQIDTYMYEHWTSTMQPCATNVHWFSVAHIHLLCNLFMYCDAQEEKKKLHWYVCLVCYVVYSYRYLIYYGHFAKCKKKKKTFRRCIFSIVHHDYHTRTDRSIYL